MGIGLIRCNNCIVDASNIRCAMMGKDGTLVITLADVKHVVTVGGADGKALFDRLCGLIAAKEKEPSPTIDDVIKKLSNA